MHTEHAAELAGQLAWAGRLAVGRGLVAGSGGNLSARRPGGGSFLITAAGSWLDRLDHGESSDFCELTLDGEVVSGKASPSSEWRLHAASYRARPDAAALIHLHPQASVLLDAAGERVQLITTDHLFYVRRVARVPFFACGTQQLADASAAALADGTNCAILAHHGCSVVADTVELAAKRALNLEEAAALTLRALALGRPVAQCPPEYLDHVAARGGH